MSVLKEIDDIENQRVESLHPLDAQAAAQIRIRMLPVVAEAFKVRDTGLRRDLLKDGAGARLRDAIRILMVGGFSPLEIGALMGEDLLYVEDEFTTGVFSYRTGGPNDPLMASR